MSFVSDNAYELVHANETVTSTLAASPNESVESVAEKLYGKHVKRGSNLKVGEHHPTPADLDRVVECGNFTSRPSDLFLQIYGEVLRTYDFDPLANLVSPPLTASTGVIPLSIISVWEASVAADIITNALRELSRRAGERGQKIVVKIMYDRGNIKQIVKQHQIVPVSEYTSDSVKLPSPEEVPNIDLEVCNYHQPLLGESLGPIVEAFYDMALLSWGSALNPPLPTLSSPPSPAERYRFQGDHAHIAAKDLDRAKIDAKESLETHDYPNDLKGGEQHGYDVDDATEKANNEKGLHDGTTASKLSLITKHLNTTLQPDTKATLPEGEETEDFTPHILHAPHDPFPIAMVNRRPRGAIEYTDVNNPQDMAWLAGLHYAEKKVFIQTPTFNAAAVVEATLSAVRKGIEVILYVNLGFNDQGEALPFQGGTNEVVIAKMFKALEPEQKKLFKVYWYTGKDMRRPVNASKKQRNCHVKLMIIDDHVGIMGNGNQDSQSWYHSQEANILIDSPVVCKDWANGIRANQNTHIYGRLDDDGIWRDPEDGSVLDDMGSTKGGTFSSTAKGLVGAVKRVQ
ncbi:hypothetical protein H0H81_003861 [Sphagnurus paluster]|uniref:PLD phosphodiesterase domain-containing protein n=1 Tax=Sphagnurus paluster TaxID=117069 RepID=A0A9P7K7C1_9AGAR|nr:hypothetical protein H0H81_003861 [Sphagnurus paluster]